MLRSRRLRRNGTSSRAIRGRPLLVKSGRQFAAMQAAVPLPKNRRRAVLSRERGRAVWALASLAGERQQQHFLPRAIAQRTAHCGDTACGIIATFGAQFSIRHKRYKPRYGAFKKRETRCSGKWGCRRRRRRLNSAPANSGECPRGGGKRRPQKAVGQRGDAGRESSSTAAVPLCRWPTHHPKHLSVAVPSQGQFGRSKRWASPRKSSLGEAFDRTASAHCHKHPPFPARCQVASLSN